MTRPALGVGLLLLTCTTAAAQKPEAERSLRLAVENDSSGGRAERRTAVGQYELGIGVRRRGFAVEYRHVSRGRDYRAQPGRHAYGALAFSLHEF